MNTKRPNRNARSIREKMLDCVAQALAPHLAVFGLRALDLQYVEIPRAQLVKGRFAGGAERFVIDGLLYTDLRVRGR